MSKMKKILPKEVVHDDEEETHKPIRARSPSADVDDWLKKYQKKQVDSALKRVRLQLKHSDGGNPAKDKPSYGISVHESELDLFSLMDSFLSEKIVAMLEAQIDPENMISPNVKLNSKTPVVASADGIPPAIYAQAQGVVGKFQTKISESDDNHGAGRAQVRFEPHPDHTKYLEKEKTQVLPKDPHHAGVAMYGNTKVRNLTYNPGTREYSIGPHKGKTPEEAISTYMEKTGRNTIAAAIRKMKNGPVN